MKYLITLALSLSFTFLIHGQSLEEKIVEASCQYLESIESLEMFEDSVNNAITKAAAEIIADGTDEEKKRISTVEGIREVLDKSKKMIPTYCPNIRRLVIEYRTKIYYVRSENEKANDYFDEGNVLMDKKAYKKAIKKFKSAIKLDKAFVFALDHIAICYRQLEKYDKSLEYYEKSLEVFSEGNVALLNIGVIYHFLENYEKSAETYYELVFLYPDDPEGYFGLARTFFVQEKYEAALNNLFIAHRIYVETESAYVKDSEKLLAYITAELKGKGQIELLYKVAEEHDIVIK